MEKPNRHVEEHHQTKKSEDGQQEVILFRPKLRLLDGPLENALHFRAVLRAERRGALIKGVNPAEREGEQQRQRQDEKPGWLNHGLNQRRADEA